VTECSPGVAYQQFIMGRVSAWKRWPDVKQLKSWGLTDNDSGEDKMMS